MLLSAMAPYEDARTQAERHVRQGEACVARQAVIVAALDRSGAPAMADLASQLLETFATSLAIARQHVRDAGRERGR